MPRRVRERQGFAAGGICAAAPARRMMRGRKPPIAMPDPNLPATNSRAPSAAWLATPAASRQALLSPEEMFRADAAAIAAGVAGRDLMEAAGRAVADAVLRRWTQRRVLVLCGPGNNGGDGFVAARHLAAAGWPVRIALLGERAALKGDAAWAAAGWPGEVVPLDPGALAEAELIVDALFGAGLDRPLAGVARAAVEAMRERGLPVVAVDVPSGVAGESGAVLGAAVRAATTVTFFRKKPGHLLLPGRELCGDLIVADIGIPDSVLASIGPRTAENGPALWRDGRPPFRPSDHKYTRGHVAVVAGAMAGAAQLAAIGAARVGAGMVSVLMEGARVAEFSAMPAAIVRVHHGDLASFAVERKLRALLIGSGLGRTPAARTQVEASLALGLPLVLDADALSLFAGDAPRLASLGRAELVVTPHDGEFQRLVPSATGDRLRRARAAAAALGATVILKGADTVIAAPDGRAAINANAPPWLATAGTGDVLAGLVLGLLGQGMPGFDAAAAACWLHGEAAQRLGPGLIADDLAGALPRPWPEFDKK
jgi:NAD(P)H-hydrate epimerase